ncbi:MAG: hypothetical protein ACJA2O_003540 [Candidatus Azotimanducaceae bacterium]|jgi:hypothetical protein
MKQMILLFVMLNICINSKAMERKEVETKNEVSELLSSRAIGEDVRAEYETYKIIPTGQVKLISSTNARSSLATSTGATVWSAQLGGFDMSIQDTKTVRYASSGLSTSKYLLAYNPRTKKPAIVTGQIIVRLNNGAKSADIAKDFGLTLFADYPHINAAFYEIDRPDELMMKVGLLRSDSRIVDAYLEVIENILSPN